MTPTVTVMVSTFRPGGLDMTLAAIRDLTYSNFEVVIVDRRYERRHDQVMDLARKYGIEHKVIHVPEHRRNGKWNTICSAWNTAIAVARGEYVIFLQDFASPEPGWIEDHLSQHAAPNRLVICPYVYVGLPPFAPLKIPGYDFSNQHGRGDLCLDLDPVLRGEVFDEMFIFEGGPFDPKCIPTLENNPARWGEDIRLSIRPGSTGGVEDGWIHLKNESILRETMLAINGLDERLERGKGPADIDVAMRLRAIGVELWWAADKGEHIACNARWYCKTMPYGAMHTSVEGRWSFTGEGMRYNSLRLAEINAATDKRSAARAKNNYAIEVLSQQLGAWRLPSWKPEPRDVDDLTYWGRNIWPEDA